MGACKLAVRIFGKCGAMNVPDEKDETQEQRHKAWLERMTSPMQAYVGGVPIEEWEPPQERVGTMEKADTRIAKHDAQIVGNIGLFYACYRLSCLGWNVMPTTRNARGIDLIAYSPDASRYLGIQVKSLSKVSPVPLGKTLDKIMGDQWIIVNNASDKPSAFIMLPNEVKERAHRGEKDGRVSYWLQPRDYDQDQFRENWDRLKLFPT